MTLSALDSSARFSVETFTQSKKLWLIANYVLDRVYNIAKSKNAFAGLIGIILGQSRLHPILENIACNVYHGGYDIKDMSDSDKKSFLSLLTTIQLFNCNDNEMYSVEVYIAHTFPESGNVHFIYVDLAIKDDTVFVKHVSELKEDFEEFLPSEEIDEMILTLAASLAS